MHLNAEERLHSRINVSLGRDQYDSSDFSEELRQGTVLLSSVSKA